MTNRMLLLVVDETQASKRAVAYVANIVSRQRDLRICLVHIVPRLPPRSLEFRGAQDPHERRLHARHTDKQRRWRDGAKKAAQRALGMATTTLRDAGVSPRALDVQFSEGVEGVGAAERILELAQARRCDTVVVGRESMSWFRELMSGNLAAELVRRGEGYTIWVVE